MSEPQELDYDPIDILRKFQKEQDIEMEAAFKEHEQKELRHFKENNCADGPGPNATKEMRLDYLRRVKKSLQSMMKEFEEEDREKEEERLKRLKTLRPRK